jgi:hypothetical protein
MKFESPNMQIHQLAAPDLLNNQKVHIINQIASVINSFTMPTFLTQKSQLQQAKSKNEGAKPNDRSSIE